jgi:hypothetical protein
MCLSGNGLVIIVHEYQVLPELYLCLLPFSISKYRCSPRTPNCTKYENKKLKHPAASNFISHSEKCSKVPFTKTWATYKAAYGGVDLGDGETVAVSSIDAQREMMQSFNARGLENPVKSVTKRGFREKWVMGIIEDDSPYSLGEKSGMKKVLDYILPKGLITPSHQTVPRDLDVLYDKLDEKVNRRLQVRIVLALLYVHKLITNKSNSSKIAIASDLWTSKNSVHVFAGTVAFWIDDNWNLRETALELLLLSGDHSGKASEKLIFKALKRRGIERKLSTYMQATCHCHIHTTNRKLQLRMVPIMTQAMAH